LDSGGPAKVVRVRDGWAALLTVGIKEIRQKMRVKIFIALLL
jgi:hypothetical protein